MSDVLQSLWSTIEDRKQNPTPESYTASLFAAGMPRIAQKVGEEGVETVVAALSQTDERVISRNGRPDVSLSGVAGCARVGVG